MKIFRSKKQFLIFFMPGFLLGIVYVNFVARKYMAEPGIFSDFFFESISVGEHRRKGVCLVSAAASGGAVSCSGRAFLYKSRENICGPVSCLDGHFSRDPGFCGGAEYGDQRKHSVPCRIVPPVPVLYPGVCNPSLVLLYSSADSLEPPDNDLCISCNVSWDYS